LGGGGVTNADYYDIKNNIFHSNAAGMDRLLVEIMASVTEYSHVLFDYNLYYPALNSAGFSTLRFMVPINSSKTYAQWQALGYDVNSPAMSDPLFVTLGSDYHLQSGSPAIAAGTPLAAPFNVDYDGVSLPTSYGWPIGAYGYGDAVAAGRCTGSFSGNIR
jgi:hypothetical protein